LTLAAGTRLGAYEVLALIGAGGMGQVYRARDTKLGRDVAIKVVSEGFGHNPERVARFEREAHLLATLNHPHIAAIYGLEESGGSQFLIMELVEGGTLADRIALTPSGSGLQASGLPVAEALAIARQVAEALQAAHEKGIIHRDLKPANIALTSDGQVKVLDFGLARELDSVRSTGLSNSPTLTLAATQAGVILGTAAYMSPEQVKGRAADRRSDVWAFGCVLFEMLTGTRACEGEDVSDTLAAVLRGDPKWTALPADVPPAVRTLIRGCLEKDRQKRIGDISAALFVLNEPTILASGSPSAAAIVPRPVWRRVAIPAGAALAAAIVAGAAVWLATRTTVPPRVSRLLITPPSAAALTISALNALGATHDVAITPDGTRVIYRGANGTTLFVRALDQLDATPLTGLGSPTNPFVSTDSQWIGFQDGRDLKRVAMTGGPAQPLARLDGGLRGATWAPDGTIVFATTNPAVGLRRTLPGEGEPLVLTRPDSARGEGDHFWPEFLPGGQAVLFTILATTGGLDQAQIAVLDLRTGMHKTLIPGGSDAHYVASGHLVYGAVGALRAVGFDLDRLAVVGTPVPVVAQVVTTASGAVNVAMAGNGTLVYVPGVGTREPRPLVWVDRLGQETPITAPPRTWDQPRISPDGVGVALHSVDENGILLWNLIRGGLTRLTRDPSGGSIYPVWTLDGGLVFASTRAGGQNLFIQAADGTGTPMQLTHTPNTQRPTSLSPDGARLVFYEDSPTSDWDVMQIRLDGMHEITPLAQTQSAERNGEVSPDGRWLAFEANNSGVFEIYVQPFSGVAGGPKLVSTGGGTQPLWARDGQELFYFAPSGALMGVRVGGGATWTAGIPKELLEGRYYTGTTTQVARMYDIAGDGRFLMIKPGGGSESAPEPTSLVVVQHFDEWLKRLVPTK
jgi:serine/threonine protein kinase